jgi:hypothetical protein
MGLDTYCAVNESGTVINLAVFNFERNRLGAGATNDYLEEFVHIVSDIWGIPVLDSRSSGIYMNSSKFIQGL